MSKSTLTLCCTMIPANNGLTMPGMVANVFENPNKMLAYWGAISKGLMLWNVIHIVKYYS